MTPIQRLFPIAAASLLLAGAGFAQTGFPFQDETLRYSVNWPSGLSLGDATLTAHKAAGGWRFAMTLDAGIPGFAVADRFRSNATAALCSLDFERETSHGARKASEGTTFDYTKGIATRGPASGGGKTETSISTCAHDALAFVYYGRRELGQGRVPPPETVYYGAGYSVRMDYTGAMSITVADRPEQVDRLMVSFKGPASDVTFEIFYARDAARTPLAVRVPFSVGTFSMELVR